MKSFWIHDSAWEKWIRTEPPHRGRGSSFQLHDGFTESDGPALDSNIAGPGMWIKVDEAEIMVAFLNVARPFLNARPASRVEDPIHPLREAGTLWSRKGSWHQARSSDWWPLE